MVSSGRLSPDVDGRPSASDRTGPGLDTTTLREVSPRPGRPLLLDRHALLLVTVGHGTHEVDFQTYQCRPGTLIRARPGQAVRYGGQPGLDAVLLAWDADLLTGLGPDVDEPAGRTHWQLAGEDEDAVISEVSQLVVDRQRHVDGGRTADLLRHQLAVLLLRLDLLPGGRYEPPASYAESVTFHRLRRELERTYRRTRRAEDYAERLGCSVRTLTRACLAATGRSAKQVIDDRVALQAMRLLAATDRSVAEIGRQLGFPEPTNFGRFFQRQVGRTPGAFRADRGRP
ncbi:helix-turn-helix transcriptional regulator, partial [Micromonospora zhanjiangensis]